MTRFEERFQDRYMPEPNSGCWLWLGVCGSHGYGQIHTGLGNILMHRISYSRNKGAIPEGLLVLHKCDVKCCINPDHLFLGTDGDNNRDRDSKGRGKFVRGGENGLSKLTEVDIRKIRLSADTQRALARRYGVAKSTVGAILRGETWKHI